jgi:hypothetical protein
MLDEGQLVLSRLIAKDDSQLVHQLVAKVLSGLGELVTQLCLLEIMPLLMQQLVVLELEKTSLMSV